VDVASFVGWCAVVLPYGPPRRPLANIVHTAALKEFLCLQKNHVKSKSFKGHNFMQRPHRNTNGGNFLEMENKKIM